LHPEHFFILLACMPQRLQVCTPTEAAATAAATRPFLQLVLPYVLVLVLLLLVLSSLLLVVLLLQSKWRLLLPPGVGCSRLLRICSSSTLLLPQLPMPILLGCTSPLLQLPLPLFLLPMPSLLSPPLLGKRYCPFLLAKYPGMCASRKIGVLSLLAQTIGR
jgi:hypothetical protein